MTTHAKATYDRAYATRAVLLAELAKADKLAEVLRYIAADQRLPTRLERMAREVLAEWEHDDNAR
jgi:hypothetical protein